jgi:iron(III) transport system permease protein
MPAVRLTLAAALLAVCGAPLIAPVAAAVRSPESPAAFAERDRLKSLAGNTAGLAAVAVAVAVPLGSLLALAAQRLPVRGRGGLRAAALVGMFVPLPVYAVAWQAVLGGWLPALALEPGAVAWRAWNTGLLPAGFVHGMAGVPWVAWVVADGLARSDADLEDDATQLGGVWAVLRRVVLPRVTLAALVAGGWVTVQTATEIPVSDAMMVRTFAEEVYTQMVGGGDGVASAVAVTVPVWLAGVLAGLVMTRRVRVSPTVSAPRPVRVPAWVGWVATPFAWGAVLLFAGLPLAALVRKACGTDPSVVALGQQLWTVIRADGPLLLSSVLWAAVTGVVVAAAARWACWAAAGSRRFAAFLFALCVLLSLTPGPLIGVGLKGLIGWLVDSEAWVFAAVGWKPTFPPLRSLLYDQPSPLPGAWAAGVRLFPLACVVLWPAVRAVPRELWEAVAIDGHGRRGEWRLVAAPLTRGAFGRAAVAVAALALGEVSAGKLVAPPGYESFVLRLFAQMHYGPESAVAGLCLVQVAVCATAGGIAWRLGRSLALPK